ncbi:hypothetical protein COEREDRAFT_82806 [Coemansia reversa NRRL 1564]|uniref:Transcriptional regulatory protein RXT2 N-terminal domain-containing protein n=1 Tax=Coemansia reversa (strain ATCC 12441 / NRRL 1564) TaxID=763665 RepID=A0A2G5B5L5_COERN|nr:hypothetical protein COEREDRAFT_82806 [Coemansia reversa NRRL 1564]|eukprot:PIA14280.1 hypothetical protein COEREDRAFT_82806 [Coemansia reversa NRRL 1564]
MQAPSDKEASNELLELPPRPRIWNRSEPHAPLPRDTEETIKEATRPLTDIPDALGRSHVQKSLSNNLLEMIAWDLMETLTAENEYNQHIRRFLNILLGDDPDTAHMELIDVYNVQEAAHRDQLVQLVQESLSRSDEFLYRISKSRDKVTFAIEQRRQLKRRMQKANDDQIKHH